MEAPGSCEMFVPVYQTMGTKGEKILHVLGIYPEEHNFNNLL
jgi:hypothetical protein